VLVAFAAPLVWGLIFGLLPEIAARAKWRAALWLWLFIHALGFAYLCATADIEPGVLAVVTSPHLLMLMALCVWFVRYQVAVPVT
jgi:hypothetical protein